MGYLYLFYTNTSSLNLYRPDALPDAQPTVSKHWRQNVGLWFLENANRKRRAVSLVSHRKWSKLAAISYRFDAIGGDTRYVATGHTSAFIGGIFVEIGKWYAVTFPYPQDTPTKSRASLLLDLLQAEPCTPRREALRRIPFNPSILQSSPRQLLFSYYFPCGRLS